MKGKPAPHDIAKVQDAIAVLKSRGDAHYKPDIAKFTGQSEAKVQHVLDHLEAKAKSNPKGKITIPWTRMRGDKGGIATSNDDRRRGGIQREQAIHSQAVRQMERCEAEFRRTSDSKEWAIHWAKAARAVGRVEFGAVRNDIAVLYLDALIVKGVPTLDAVKSQLELMMEIDAL